MSSIISPSSTSSPPSTISRPSLLRIDPVHGARVSSALNIIFSPKNSPLVNPASFNNCTLQSLFDKTDMVESPKTTNVNQQKSGGHQQIMQVYSNQRPPIDKDSLSVSPVPNKNSTTPIFSDISMGLCSECGKRITSVSSACQALGCVYHNDCFVCCCCRRTLRGKTFYKDQDKIYCEEDYLYCGFQRMAEKCAECGHIISQTILQTMGNSYHPGCFRCCVCNKCLDQVPFTVDQSGQVYCLPDYYLVSAPVCAACTNPILPEEYSEDVVRVVAMNKEFHLDCYRCEDCKIELSDAADRRWYPLVEQLDGPDNTESTRTHLLCLQCHLSRIGATPASGQHVPTRRGSNSSAPGDQSMGSLERSNMSSRVYTPTPTSYSIASIVKSPYQQIDNVMHHVLKPRQL